MDYWIFAILILNVSINDGRQSRFPKILLYEWRVQLLHYESSVPQLNQSIYRMLERFQ